LNLYILQHGEAEPEEVDPGRALSELGRRDIRLLAMHMQNVGVQLGRILHSGKLRAEQSARLIAESVPPGIEPEQAEGLKPNDDPAVIAGVIESSRESILIVSHMPFVSRLCSMLLTGATETAFASVPGTLFCLEYTDGKWRLAYMLRPDFL
jgi:phosphohistidine phosphatase